MITSEAYQNKLRELENISIPDRPIKPEHETSFNVFLNTRKIEVPQSFKQIAMKGDHNAETIWFTMDRYFDGEDLYSSKKKWGVQFINAKKEELLVPVDYKEISGSTLKLGWDIPYDLTKEAGSVTLGLRCWGFRDMPNNSGKEVVYDLFTDEVYLTIGDGLYITSESENLQNPPKDKLSHLVGIIEELYMNKEATEFSYQDLRYKPTINGYELLSSDNGYDNKPADFKINYADLVQDTLPKITVDGQIKTIGVDAIEVTKVAVDSALGNTENPVQNKVINAEIININSELGKIKEAMENMTYIPLSVKSFVNNINLVEINHTYSGNVIFTWEVDGNIKSQRIEVKQGEQVIANITDIAIDDREYVYNAAGLTNNTVCTLIITDAQNKETKKSTNIDFTYKIFYGTSNKTGFADKAFATELQGSQLSKTKSIGRIEVAAGVDEYIFFCLPASYGVPRFKVGGFDGGFDLVNENITYNLTKYNVYKSTNANLGSQIVEVE